MATRFEDPLDDVDPIMAEAFSTTEVPMAREDVVTSANYEKEAPPIHSQVNRQEPAPSYNPNVDVVSDIQFPVFDEEVRGQQMNLDVFSNIPVNLSVELGRSEISLKEVYELTEGSIIELDRMVGEPLDLVVNGQVIAQGEVVAIDNNFGLRITSVVAKAPPTDAH